MDNENIKRIYKKIKVEQITICWSEVFIKRNGNSISNFCFIDLSKNYLTEEVKKEKNILIMLYNALKAKLLKDNSVVAKFATTASEYLQIVIKELQQHCLYIF